MHACTRDRKLLLHGEIGVHNVNTCVCANRSHFSKLAYELSVAQKGWFPPYVSLDEPWCVQSWSVHARIHASCMRACIHTCIQNTYILPCMHSCIRLYIQNAYMHTCIHRHIRRQAGRQTDRQTVYACMYACKHTCMHAYILTYMHSCMHAYWPARSPLRPIAPHCAHPQCLDRP